MTLVASKFLNGTCNYILTKMEEDSIDFATALAQAQDLGYAEADPTLDVNGTDAAHKLAILARITGRIKFTDVIIEGNRKRYSRRSSQVPSS